VGGAREGDERAVAAGSLVPSRGPTGGPGDGTNDPAARVSLRGEPADGGRTPPESATLSVQFGDYELLREVARGAMGVVYQARQLSLDRVVALKMILPGEQGSEEEEVERFRREAQAAARLDHPNIVPVYGFGQHQGRYFFSMAYVEGPTLKEVVRQGGLPDPAQAVAWLLAVAEAVEFAHQAGVIHRDLKPENVLIDGQGRPRITDFGVAKRVTGSLGRTLYGQVIGTPAYMPPEQALGKQDQVGPWSDVYCLGGILYFLLTGRPPFGGGSVTEVLCHVVQDPPTPPREINPQAPVELETICRKCLEKTTARRYASARALAEDLRRFTAREPLSSFDSSVADPLVSPALPSWRPPVGGRSRRPWLALAAGLLVVAVGVWVVRHYFLPRVQDHQQPGPGEPRPSVPVPRPDQLRRDFGLEVEMLGVQPGKDGVRLLREGQEVRFRIKVEREAYVAVWSINADGTIYQLFPNAWEREHRFKKGEERVVPSPEAGVSVEAEQSNLPRAVDQVWVEASTEPWKWDAVGQKGDGPWLLFPPGEVRQKWGKERVLLRNLKLKPHVALAEQVLKYHVGPAR
jgi:serine/threonine protein kinase